MTSNPTGVLHVYYEPSLSGITRHVSHIIEGLRDEYRFHVLCSTDDPRIGDFFRDRGVGYTSVPAGRIFTVRGMIKTLFTARGRDWDIVHIHNLQSLFWASAPSLFLPRTRFIFTPQVVEFDSRFLDRGFFAAWRLSSFLVKTIIVLTEHQKEVLIRRKIKGADAIYVIPNSLEPENIAIKSQETSPSPLPPGRWIVTIGRLVPQKNPDLFASIASKVCEEFPDIRFAWIGEGPLEERLRALLRESGMSDRVILTGFRRDARQILRQAEIFLSTALWEGMPYSVLEAMQAGKPVVVSDIDGHRALVEDGRTGYIARSEENYLEDFNRLIRSAELRETMGRASRARFEAEFSFDRFIERMRLLYTSVAI
ncbi:MAG TPA: glycosyltransferase family 4 protein [Candidatus Sumerlaeota bacterium]|nr:glycosyltransferase family 4 protein [Candidatus Sumerlaeota bacterium]